MIDKQIKRSKLMNSPLDLLDRMSYNTDDGDDDDYDVTTMLSFSSEPHSHEYFADDLKYPLKLHENFCFHEKTVNSSKFVNRSK